LDEEGQSFKAKDALASLTADLKRIGGILGILQEPWQSFFEERAKSQRQTMSISAEAIDALVAERAAARKNKDWKRADEIRDQLEQAGILLEDRGDGTQWKMAT
jgi:cysteinyl-tRNA synthetase